MRTTQYPNTAKPMAKKNRNVVEVFFADIVNTQHKQCNNNNRAEFAFIKFFARRGWGASVFNVQFSVWLI